MSSSCPDLAEEVYKIDLHRICNHLYAIKVLGALIEPKDILVTLNCSRCEGGAVWTVLIPNNLFNEAWERQRIPVKEYLFNVDDYDF